MIDVTSLQQLDEKDVQIQALQAEVARLQVLVNEYDRLSDQIGVELMTADEQAKMEAVARALVDWYDHSTGTNYRALQRQVEVARGLLRLMDVRR